MIAPVTNPTALVYWLEEANGKENRISYKEIINSENYNSCDKQSIIRDAVIFHMDLPLSVIFQDSKLRWSNKNFRCNTLPRGVPTESFVKLTDNLYVICPELVFLLAAKHMSLAETVQLGNNLCAIYRTDDFSPYKQINRDQIVTVEEIKKYLANVQKVDGLVNARQAAKYIMNRSNSPIESFLAVIFHLPISLGGAGIDEIELNQIIKLKPEAAELLAREYICCDIGSKIQKKVFEYDSKLVHLTANQHKYDKRRTNALQMNGYKVFSITADDLSNHRTIEKLMLSARSFLGLRTHADRFNKYQELRWHVMDQLYFKKH